MVREAAHLLKMGGAFYLFLIKENCTPQFSDYVRNLGFDAETMGKNVAYNEVQCVVKLTKVRSPPTN